MIKYKIMSQGFLSHFQSGFVCFMLILGKISGERLQDHCSFCPQNIGCSKRSDVRGYK